MADEGFKRKLAAILSADVEGYSRLMDDDEEATVRTLKTYRTTINDLVQQYRGRIVDSPGDNILAEFSSVVDAVNCAVELQRDLAERNTELAYNRQMQFRIGVNLGDVIEDDGNIYGDGVNIAARVESLAEAGGICISGRAYDQVSNKLGLEYENLGEHQVKNISTPIRVFRVLSFPGAAAHRVVRAKEAVGRKWRIVAMSVTASIMFCLGVAYFVWDIYFRLPTVDTVSAKEKHFSLSEGPSIAVLPFENMSGDPEQDYFCDGLTENIITGLSSTPRLLVIARNSSFAYKGKPMKIPQIANELGVRYVVEGSVQKTGERLRITVQLIDAKSGHHMWAEKYDRDLNDIFELQDELTLNIMAALEIRLTEGEQARFRLRRSCSLEAIMKALKALEYLRRNNKDAVILARQKIQEAITLCPESSESYTLLAQSHIMELYFQSKNPLISVAQASKALKKAISLDENNSDAYLVLGYLYLMRRQHDEAIAAAEKAISLNPNGADAYSNLGYILYNSERYDESVEFINKAIRLNPLPPSYYFLWLGHSKRGLKRYGEALEVYRKSSEIEPNNIFSHLQLAITYELMGQGKAARAAAAQVVRIDPTFSLKRYEKITPFKNRKVLKLYLDAAKKAGLSE